MSILSLVVFNFLFARFCLVTKMNSSASILKFISNITVKLYPYYGNDTTARAFFMLIKNPKALEANENCVAKMITLPKYEPASVEIQWEDKSEQKFVIEDMKLPKLLEEISRKRTQLTLGQKLREIKNEWEPEPDPFEESRIENEKRHAEKQRKSAAAKKTK